MLKTIDIQKLLGRAYLKDTEHGERHRAEILEVFDSHIQQSRLLPKMMRVKIRCNGKDYNDLIQHNEILDFIDQDYHIEDNIFAIRKIVSHKGPFTKTSPDKYKGSMCNLLIEWESGERTWIPMKNIASVSPATYASYTQAHNMLDKPGWAQFRKMAKRMTHMINTSKVTSVKGRPHTYMFGYRIPGIITKLYNLTKPTKTTSGRKLLN